VSRVITVNGAQGIKLSWEVVPGRDSTTICGGLGRDTRLLASPIYPNARQPRVRKAGSSSLGRNGVASPIATTARLNQFGANELTGVASCENSTRSIIFKTKYNFPPVALIANETTGGGLNVTAKFESGFAASCSGASNTFDWQAI
jgi:hypothetical protein